MHVFRLHVSRLRLLRLRPKLRTRVRSDFASPVLDVRKELIKT